jgi:hypothetical protein
MANGPSYGFDCTVVTQNGADVRARIEGAVVGRLRRNTDFIPNSASYDSHRHVWYYVPEIYQSRIRGWINSDDVSCDATSFH